MAANVGEIVAASAAALGRSQREFLKEVATSVKPSGSGDSDPKRETILGYEKFPETRCGYKFAGMALDFLHVHRVEIRNQRKLNAARNACRTILLANQKVRFRHVARTNPASINRVEQIAGVYLLIRRATSDHILKQELLILSYEAESEQNTFATYVNPEVVCRGMWCVVRDTVSCMTNGYRRNWRPDVVNFHLLYEEPDSGDTPAFLSGFAAGLTSQTALPAVVPVVAVRILDNRSSQKLDISYIGNGGDAEIRASWRLVADETSERFEKIGEILDRAMDSNNGSLVRRDGELSGKITQSVGKIEAIISQRVIAFCRRFSWHDGWK